MTSFLDFLYSKVPKKDGRDKLSWSLSGSSQFDVCSYYAELRGLDDISFPWKSIWDVKAPRRASFFVWIASWEKFLLMIIPLRGATLLLAGVVCAERVGDICYFIVMLPIGCGVWF